MREGKRLVVVGGGPAGLAAALQAARLGMVVTVVEEQATLGGQYFRGRQASEHEGSPRHFYRQSPGTQVLVDTAVFDAPADGLLSIWSQGTGARALAYDALVLATGAVDRPVALPGWTLPGVLTAGAASILAKAYGVAPGHRVLVAGTGPFLLAAADDLTRIGCRVRVIEATPLSTSIGGLPVIARNPELARQMLGYAVRLAARGVRWGYGRMVTSIHGDDRVEAATIQRVDQEWHPLAGSQKTVEVDAVCLGFGFVPQLELAQLLGCEIRYCQETSDFAVRTDAAMRTSLPHVYAGGEITGLAGMPAAVAEGRTAGLTAAHDLGLLSDSAYAAQVQELAVRMARLRRMTDWARRAFRPRIGLWSLAGPSTILCRCEDVSVAAAEAALKHTAATPLAVKAATRSGMGLCQGRICSFYLTEWLRARHGFQVADGNLPWRIRPPIRPVPLGEWLALEEA